MESCTHYKNILSQEKTVFRNRSEWGEGRQACKWKQGSLLSTIKLMELRNNMLGLAIML